MKKFLTIALCVLFVGVMAVSAFASAFELGEYGQQTVSVPVATTAPFVDGAVTEGEYTWSASTAIADNTASAEGFFVNSNGADSVEGVDLYASYDDNYLYLAAVITDAAAEATDFCYFDVGVGSDMATNNLDIYMPKYGIDALKGNIEVWLNDARADEYVDEAAGSSADGQLCYEISIDRAMLATLAGTDSVDTFFFSFQYYLANAATRTIFYGFDSEELTDVATATSFPAYSHVMTLAGAADAEDTEAPADDNEGVLDGGADIEVDADTDSVDTDPVDTDPVETDPVDTESEPVDTEAPAAAKSGCGASVAAACVAMIAALGTCVAFVTKK